MKNKKNLTKIIVSILTFAIIIGIFALFLNFLNKPKELSFDGKGSYVQNLKEGKITEIMFKNNNVYFNVKDNNKNENAIFSFKKPFEFVAKSPINIAYSVYEDYVKQHTNADIKVQFTFPSNIKGTISSVFTVLLLVFWVILIFAIFKGGALASGGLSTFNKTKAKLTNNIEVRFSDVAGAEEEKQELQEIVEFLKHPTKYSQMGAKVPKGVLLIGPPGTGKTLFAKAIAGEAGVPFYTTSGSEFSETFVGTGAARVRDLFEQAKNNAPCIIFIDEIDALGRERSNSMSGNDETLNQLLVQMDGFDTAKNNVIIIAATNRVDVLDPALIRSGRFSRQIYVNLPDVKGREDILKVHSKNKPLAKNISFKILARMTSGFSGADIENILNEAAMRAVRENRQEIIMVDILESINRLIAGPKKISRVITEYDKKITAYHECGHAIVAKVLDGCDDVQEISIVPRGNAAGYTITRPINDNNHTSRTKLIDNIAMMLGGRAAEKLIIKDYTTGASNDIERATEIATKMVTEWGMSEKVGIVNLSKNNDNFFSRGEYDIKRTSAKVSELVDAEIKKILDSCFEKATQIITERRELIDNMVSVLFKCDTIYTNEVNMLFEGKTPEEVLAYINEKTLELGTDTPRNLEEIMQETQNQ